MRRREHGNLHAQRGLDECGGEPPGHTLQTSALVNEAYLRLSADRETPFEDRQHYFRVAAHVMRCVLVDHARRRGARKRETGERVDLDEAAGSDAAVEGEVLRLLRLDDGAEERLAAVKPRGGMVHTRVQTNEQYYQGEMDELSFYHRALTAAEIQSIFRAGSAGKCRPGR